MSQPARGKFSERPVQLALPQIGQSADLAGGCGDRHEAAGARQFTVAVVVVAQFLQQLGDNVSLAVYPFIWTEMVGGDKGRGASLHAVGIGFNALGEFLSASLLGMLSDSFGRRPALILSTLGQIVDFSLAAMSVSGSLLSLGGGAVEVVLAGRCFSGLCGNFRTFARASLGDASTTTNSAGNFAALFAVISLTYVVGALVGGVLGKVIGLQVPMLIATGAGTLNLAIVGFVMPEPLRTENRKQRRWCSASPFGAMGFLLTSRFLTFFAMMTLLDTFCLNMMAVFAIPFSIVKFGVGPAAAGSAILVFGISQMLTFFAGLRPVVRCFGEIQVLKVGYAMTCATFVLLALISYTDTFALMYFAGVLMGVGTISLPLQISIASRCVAPSQQGMLQAGNGSVDVVGKVLVSGIVSLTFGPLVSAEQPGGIWWIAAGLMLPGAALASSIRRFLPRSFCESRGRPRGDHAGSADGGCSPQSSTVRRWSDGSACVVP